LGGMFTIGLNVSIKLKVNLPGLQSIEVPTFAMSNITVNPSIRLLF